MNHYDVFISYKQTDLQGDFTPDSETAATLCRILEEKGLSVFFSEKTIFEIGISDYKKAIDSALEHTRILVVLASKSEYLTSGWVEYEYESFYEDILSGRNSDGKIISYTAAEVSASLPRTLSRFQNYTNDRFSPDQIAEFLMRSLGAPKEGKTSETTARTDAAEKKKVSDQLDRKGPHKSIYASDYSNEFRRLEIQAQNSAGSDRLALDYLFGTHPWDEDEPLYVIDAGSAYGYVSADRFEPLEQVAKILCLDNNPRTIERAAIRFADHSKMIFECFDLESDNMEQELEALLEKHHIPRVHIIYSALTLHHLKNPDRVLRRLRKCMDRGSYIILRGSDDGSKLCYPKSDLMESII